MKQSMAAMVVVLCLGAQVHAIVRPMGDRLWPFVAYPMFASSSEAGATYQLRELRARTCGARPQAWKVPPRDIGLQLWRYLGALDAVVTDRPTARAYRADMARVAATRLVPRPCALQVWERAVTMTRAGADQSALRDPRWTPLVEWRVDAPDEVVALARQ